MALLFLIQTANERLRWRRVEVRVEVLPAYGDDLSQAITVDLEQGGRRWHSRRFSKWWRIHRLAGYDHEPKESQVAESPFQRVAMLARVHSGSSDGSVGEALALLHELGIDDDPAAAAERLGASIGASSDAATRLGAAAAKLAASGGRWPCLLAAGELAC